MKPNPNPVNPVRIQVAIVWLVAQNQLSIHRTIATPQSRAPILIRILIIWTYTISKMKLIKVKVHINMKVNCILHQPHQPQDFL